MTTTKTDKITKRQLELLAQLCSGLSIAEAAKKLFMADRTAYNVIAAARRKAGVGSNERLVVVAIIEGWLEFDDDGKASVASDFS